MNTAFKRLWPLAVLLGLVCSFPALAHDYDDGGYWRHHHHHHRHHGGYYGGWERPYYAPPPRRYLPPPPYYAPPPPVRYDAPMPGWQAPHHLHRDWR